MVLNPGQGQPVPESVGHGVWIGEDVVWWNLADDSTTSPGSKGELIAMVGPGRDGKPEPQALSASRYAAGLDVDIDTLIAANASGDLDFEMERVESPEPGGSAIRVTVGLGTRQYGMTIVRLPME